MRKFVFFSYELITKIMKLVVSPLLSRLLARPLSSGNRKTGGFSVPAEYWSAHLVPYEDWSTAAESLDYFHWRNAQYPGYIDLMPVNGARELTVVDYGCGPGNDLVGFYEFSKPERLIGLDVSEQALAVAKDRLKLHGCRAELYVIDDELNKIPLEDNSVDLIHSSGVLHHVKNLGLAFEEIKRVMKVGGRLQVMVYNYDSLWLHLYTAFVHQIEMGLYDDLTLLEAFQKTTDGPDCPISNCYRPKHFVELVSSFGMHGCFRGSAISLLELELLSKRLDAIRSRQLAREHRDFLSSLTFDPNGHPVFNGHVAGVPACYEFIKKY